MTNYEKETIINYNEEEKTANVYTCRKSLMRKLDLLCEKYPDNYQLIKSDQYSKTYTVNKRLINIRIPRKKKVLSTDEKLRFINTIKKNQF